MALYYDLPVFKETYALTLRLFELTQNFPREYKFTLGQDIKHDCINLVRSIYRANKCKDKAIYLEHFLDNFEVEIAGNCEFTIRQILSACRTDGFLDVKFGELKLTCIIIYIKAIKIKFALNKVF